MRKFKIVVREESKNGVNEHTFLGVTGETGDDDVDMGESVEAVVIAVCRALIPGFEYKGFTADELDESTDENGNVTVSIPFIHEPKCSVQGIWLD